MNRVPKAWKKKVKANLKKKIGMSERTAEAAVKTIWRDGMKEKCRQKVIKKYQDK